MKTDHEQQSVTLTGIDLVSSPLLCCIGINVIDTSSVAVTRLIADQSL